VQQQTAVLESILYLALPVDDVGISLDQHILADMADCVFDSPGNPGKVCNGTQTMSA